jgi:hypothetical protein
MDEWMRTEVSRVKRDKIERNEKKNSKWLTKSNCG